MAKGLSKSMMKRSIVIMLVFVVVCFGTLIGFLLYYQIFNHSYYESRALQQQTLDTEITAKSGTIYDCNYVKLGESSPVETISVCPPEVKDDAMARDISKNLAEILEMEYDTVYQKVTKQSRYERIKRKVDVNTADKVRAYIKESKAKGIHFEEDTKRYYPYGSLASQIIGFRGVDNQGLFGIEKVYDNYLTGTNGKIITAKNAAGNELPVQYETYVEAQNGQDVVLTIDTAVQQYLDKHLAQARKDNKATSAAGIVMSVKTGEILAMSVQPDFDLNDPYTITDETMLEELKKYTGEEYKTKKSEYQNSLWRNMLVSDTYEPGSTFKIVTSAMGLEEGLVTPQTGGFVCNGYAMVAGTRIGCWKHAGHGSQTFQEAIQNSCNPSFIKLGQMIGNKTFLKYVNAFGLQEKTGVDLLGEASGIFHKPTAFNEVELATSSFGQTFKVTPVEMLSAACAVANGGNLMQPHVVKQITETDSEGNIKVVKNIAPVTIRQVVSEETSKTLCEMLENVVSKGSGKNAYVKGYHVAGKTGTSEKIDQKNEEGQVDKYIASFIGFAPANNPEIAILIMINEPSAGEYFGGLIAAPVAGDVLSDVLPYLGIQPQYTEEELATIEVTVPGVLDKESDAAVSELTRAGFKYKLVGGAGRVENQNPSSGSQIPKDGTVILYTNGASPSNNCVVPDLNGLTLANAKRELEDMGLNIRVTGNTNAGSVVCMQEPVAGSKAAGGSIVTVKLKSYSNVAD